MRDKTGYIYKITSPSGKIYIGSTDNYNRRLGKYRRLAVKPQIRIYNSLVKYGFDTHIFEVIEEPLLKDLYIREAYWGEYYDVLGSKGLNCMLPKGDGYASISEETRLKISNTHKGKTLSEEHKLAISRGGLGKKHSKETKLKISKNNGWSKIVLNLETGVYYRSAKEASESINYSYYHLIDMLNPNSKTNNKTPLMYV